MLRFFRLLGLLFLVFLWSCAVRAADVTLTPVNVRLDRANDRATVQVYNNGQEPVLMQAEAIVWQRVQGLDIDGPTTDLIVNPPVFTVQPGQTQVLRLGLRRSTELAQEATYRIVLREVPLPRPSDALNVAGSVRVLVALRVPVYVQPAQVRRSEQWKVSRAANGDLMAEVANTGNVHLKVGDLRLQGQGGEPLALPCGSRLGAAFKLLLAALGGLHHLAHAQATQSQVGREARAGVGRRQGRRDAAAVTRAAVLQIS